MTQLRRLIGSVVAGAWGGEPDDIEESAIRCIRAADFDYRSLRPTVESAPLRMIDARIVKRIQLSRGDLILEKSGGGARTPVGRAVLYDSDLPAICSNFAARIRPATGIDSRFLTYLLASLYSRGATESCVTQTTGIQNLDVDVWLETPVAEVSIEQQRQIADFLDDQVARIDNIFAAREKQQHLLDQEQASLADHLLADHIWDDATRLGRFILRIEQGWSPQCEAVGADDDEWGVLKVSAIRQGRFVPSENKRLPDDLRPQCEYEVRGGDLFVTRANTPKLVGAFAVAPHDTRPRLIFSDKIMRLTLCEGLDPEFVALVGQTRAVRDLLSSAGTGTSQSMVNVRGSDIRDIRVPVVDARSQRILVARHRDMTARIETEQGLLERQTVLITELKRSLITATVSGEFDVSAADGSRMPA